MYKLREDRLVRIMRELESLGLEQMVIASPVNIDYLTGYLIKPFEQFYVLYLCSGKLPTLYCSEVNGTVEIEGIDVRTYGPLEEPLAWLASELKSGRLGIDQTWSARFLLPLLQKRSDLVPVLSSAAIEYVRMIKDSEEMAKMRRASLMDDGVFERGFAMIDGERTEVQMSNLMGHLFEKAIGKHMGVSMVSYGINAANPHHQPTEATLKPGECVLIDSGKALDKYMSDMTRTAFYGHVSERHRALYEIVLEANLAGIAAAKESALASAVDHAAREVITKAGFGEYFIHRVGHGIGLEGHEFPSIDAHCDIVLQPGMCFTVEPGIYLPGEIGIRIEDVVMITENGTEVLNQYTKELQIIC